MRALVAALLSVVLVHAADAQVAKPKYNPKPFQPVVKTAMEDYVGHYAGVDTTYCVDVKLAEGDKLAVTVHDRKETFDLRKPQVDGAILTGILKTRDNLEHKFEGVFGIRDNNGRRTFGLLVNQEKKVDQDVVVDRLFCTRAEAPEKPK